ncbi:ribonuclease H-like domain-containing protein [Tanacetum coccineum]
MSISIIFHADGSLSRYKARLVANGRSQILVVKPATIHIVLSLALSRDWPVHQLDVNNAFLHGSLSKIVYMHQPPGFNDLDHPDYVCLLQRSFYGLKQAPRAWYQCFTSYVTRVGFHHSKSDSSLFIFHHGSEAHMEHCNPCRTHIDTESNLGPEGDSVNDPTLYRSLAGALQYLTFTQPGITYAVQQVCLHMHDPHEHHLAALKRILRYVREAEYRGVANVIAETAWIRNLLLELHSPLHAATLVYCDNV